MHTCKNSKQYNKKMLSKKKNFSHNTTPEKVTLNSLEWIFTDVENARMNVYLNVHM